MPLVTLSVQAGLPRADRRALLDAVHAALVAVGVPPADRFQRVLELDADSFVFDRDYPDQAGRDARFAIVEILWSAGRSVKVKRQLLEHLQAGLERAGFDPSQLMVVWKETAWENWAFTGLRLLHA